MLSLLQVTAAGSSEQQSGAAQSQQQPRRARAKRDQQQQEQRQEQPATATQEQQPTQAQQLRQPQQQQQQQQPKQQQQYLYEPKYGLPVVRRRLGYSELLRCIRQGEVDEVRFFTTHENATQMEGPCLVVLTDGTVAQGHIPDGDWRCAHGGRGCRDRERA